jgi:anti-sigma regulatory factor (Ser/Thr protein kinase)
VRSGGYHNASPQLAAMQNAEIRITNQLSEIGRVIELLDGFCRHHALSDRVRHDMSLALQEIISNIVHYSYRENTSTAFP